MCASSSVQLFESFSKSIQWILQNKFHVDKVSHIIDDFIFVGGANSDECQNGLSTFLSLSKAIGIPIKHSKTVLPTTQAEVHGITIDSTTMMATLPMDKVETLKNILRHNMKRR